jgi:hypothetical protein
VAATIHQALAGEPFKVDQRLGHRGLAQGKAFGGAGEVAVLRHRDQAAQVAQLDVADEGSGIHLINYRWLSNISKQSIYMLFPHA